MKTKEYQVCKEFKYRKAFSFMEQEVKLSAKYPKYAFAFVLILGIAFPIIWGITGMKYFNQSFKEAFIDVGVYSVSVVLIGFGLIGFLLYRYMEKEENKND